MVEHKVFVYGTLKRGQSNHCVLGEARYLGEGYLQPSQFTMFNLGPFPALVPSNAEFSPPVQGELYLVDDEELARLDVLEGYPDFYNRRSVGVYSKFGLYVCDALVYYMATAPEGSVIESGEW